MIVRHLVLPGNLAGTKEVVNFIAKEISPHTYINIMDQYYPAFRAKDFPPLDRKLQSREFESAIKGGICCGIVPFCLIFYIVYSVSQFKKPNAELFTNIPKQIFGKYTIGITIKEGN